MYTSQVDAGLARNLGRLLRRLPEKIYRCESTAWSTRCATEHACVAAKNYFGASEAAIASNRGSFRSGSQSGCSRK